MLYLYRPWIISLICHITVEWRKWRCGQPTEQDATTQDIAPCFYKFEVALLQSVVFSAASGGLMTKGAHLRPEGRFFSKAESPDILKGGMHSISTRTLKRKLALLLSALPNLDSFLYFSSAESLRAS